MKRRCGSRSPSVILRYFSLYMNPSTRQHPLPGSPSSAREERAVLEGWGQERVHGEQCSNRDLVLKREDQPRLEGWKHAGGPTSREVPRAEDA